MTGGPWQTGLSAMDGELMTLIAPAGSPATRDKALQQQALEQFLAGVEHRAYASAHGALWEREAALEVVQDAMLRFVQYYRQRPAAEWPPLFHAVLNSRINDARRRRMLAQGARKLVSLTGLGTRQPQDDQRESELPAPAHDEGLSDPEAAVLGDHLAGHIQAALASLSPRQRQVFLLRQQQGLSVRETAATLSCSETSVKQHHFRAMGALRKQLAEVWDHD